MIGLELRHGRELARISRELRGTDNRELRLRFTRELRAAARPLVPAVRAAIHAIPATSGQHSGLRRRMARATRLRVRTRGRDAGVAVMVDGRKMPPGQRAIPAYMEGVKPRWRHPVFGNRHIWVSQEPHPYFYRTVRPLGVKSRQAVNRVLDDISKKIT